MKAVLRGEADHDEKRDFLDSQAPAFVEFIKRYGNVVLFLIIIIHTFPYSGTRDIAVFGKGYDWQEYKVIQRFLLEAMKVQQVSGEQQNIM